MIMMIDNGEILLIVMVEHGLNSKVIGQSDGN